MSINTHCQALLQWNKHNEQHLHIHAILRNLGNRPGKIPMQGSPKREIYWLQESSTTYNFQQGKNSLTTPKIVSNFLPRELCQNCTIVRAPLTVHHLKICAHSEMYRHNCMASSAARSTSISLDFCAHKQPQKMFPLPCCIDCTDPYSMVSNNNNKTQQL